MGILVQINIVLFVYLLKQFNFIIEDILGTKA